MHKILHINFIDLSVRRSQSRGVVKVQKKYTEKKTWKADKRKYSYMQLAI